MLFSWTLFEIYEEHMQVEISFIRVTRVLSCHFRFRIYQCKRLLINGTSALFLTSSGLKVIAINHVCFYYLLEEFKVFPRSSRHVSHEMDLSVLHWNENQFNLFYLQINCPRALFETIWETNICCGLMGQVIVPDKVAWSIFF